MYIVRDHIVILVKSEPERHELQGGQQFTFNIKELYLYIYPWATVLVYIIPFSVSFPHPSHFLPCLKSVMSYLYMKNGRLIAHFYCLFLLKTHLVIHE